MAKLSSILRAIGSIPGRIGGAFVDEEPIMRPAMRRDRISLPGVGSPEDDELVPGFVGVRRGDLSPAEEIEFETPTGELEQIGSRRRPSRLAMKLANIAGQVGDNFITAMNAPVAGNRVGTIGQVTNALGAIRNENERRGMRDFAMQRQAGIDQMNADVHGAQMERYRAQAAEDRAQADAMRVPMTARLEEFRSTFRAATGRDPSEQEMLVHMKLATPAPAESREFTGTAAPGSEVWSRGQRIATVPFAPARPSAEPSSPFAAVNAAKRRELGRDLTSQELLDLAQGTRTEPREPFAMLVAQMEREQGKPLSAAQMRDLQQQMKQSPYGPPPVVIMQGSTPTIVPRTEAFGQPAAVTTFDERGMPSTGGVAGVSRSAPPAIPTATQEQFANFDTSIQQFREVREMMKDPKFQALGPILGRVKLFEINKLGGFGATPEQIKMAARLQRLLSQQAFAQGGKALTPTELQQFERVTPSQSDTVQKALTLADEALVFLERAREARMNAMPERQRSQMGGGSRRVPQAGDKKTYQGATYTFDGKDWVR